MPIELGSFSLGTVVGGIIVTLVGHSLTKIRNTEERKIKKFNDAVSEFRNAFHPEISALTLGHGNRPNPYEILPPAFDRHKSAVFKFAKVLPIDNQVRLAEAWKEYYSRTDTTGTYQYFEQYDTSGFDYSREESNERKDLAFKRLSKIISFCD